MNNLTEYTNNVKQLVAGGNFRELIDTYGINRVPRYSSTPPIVKSELSTLEVMELAKTKSNNRKFGRQFAGQTPDWSQKNPTEERDVESWGEARQRKGENRDFGLPEENDMSTPTPATPNAAKPSRSKFLVNPVQIAAEQDPDSSKLSTSDLRELGLKRYREALERKRPENEKKEDSTPDPLSVEEIIAERKKNPPPELAMEYIEKEGTGGHGVGDTAGAQVANGMAGLASGGTAYISTNAGIFTATHGGSRGKKIKRTSDGSHTVGEENFTDRGNYVPALTEYVKKQFLDKAKAPYYNRNVQGLNTSTIRDQKSQKRQSKQNNMAGNKRTSIWRNP
jgi:hypothetical protein